MRGIPHEHPGHRDDDWVGKRFDVSEAFCPRMEPGDALVFSHYCLHRTQPMGELTGDRIGSEMRFTIRPTDLKLHL